VVVLLAGGRRVLKRIRVKGYKSLDDVELELGDLTVVVGPNAAGKSNLLDAIYLLGRLGTSQTLNDAFAGHRGNPLEAFTVSEGGLESLIQSQKSVQFTLSADIHLEDDLVNSVEADIAKMREGLPEATKRASPTRRRVSERDMRYTVTPAVSVIQTIRFGSSSSATCG
jgi:predicted ATPase